MNAQVHTQLPGLPAGNVASIRRATAVLGSDGPRDRNPTHREKPPAFSAPVWPGGRIQHGLNGSGARITRTADAVPGNPSARSAHAVALTRCIRDETHETTPCAPRKHGSSMWLHPMHREKRPRARRFAPRAGPDCPANRPCRPSFAPAQSGHRPRSQGVGAKRQRVVSIPASVPAGPPRGLDQRHRPGRGGTD